jgi:hypothetical protein
MAWAGALLVLGLGLGLTACAVPGMEDDGGYGVGDDGYVVGVPHPHRGDKEPVVCYGCGRPEHRDRREPRDHHHQPDHGVQRAQARPSEAPRHRAPETRHESRQSGGHHKSEKSEKKN